MSASQLSTFTSLYACECLSSTIYTAKISANNCTISSLYHVNQDRTSLFIKILSSTLPPTSSLALVVTVAIDCTHMINHSLHARITTHAYVVSKGLRSCDFTSSKVLYIVGGCLSTTSCHVCSHALGLGEATPSLVALLLSHLYVACMPVCLSKSRLRSTPPSSSSSSG